jgi:ACS family glucarate transporter-like MFS transporter
MMAFLCALSFLTYFDRVCIMRAQEDIKADLGLTQSQMGVILGAFWFAYALFELPGGWLGDRFGTRPTLTRIVFAWSLFTALSGSATGFVSLLVSRLLFGVGEAGAFPNMARAQERWLPVHSRARAGGLLFLVARWGGAFSPLLFGTLLRAFGSERFRLAARESRILAPLADVAAWRLSFWTAGLFGALWCVVFFRWFRDDPARHPGVNASELALIQGERVEEPSEHRFDRDVWSRLVRSRSLWALGALYLCGSFGWSFFVSWAPAYLKQTHGAQMNGSEVMTGLPLFCGGISCLLGGSLCDLVVKRTGKKRLVRALFTAGGYGSAAAAMWGLRFSTTAEEATLLMCIAAASGDFAQGANWASIVDVGGRYAGIAAGLVNMVGNGGNYLQPSIGAWVSGSFGYGTMFGLYAAMYVVAASMWLFIDPEKSFYER